MPRDDEDRRPLPILRPPTDVARTEEEANQAPSRAGGSNAASEAVKATSQAVGRVWRKASRGASDLARHTADSVSEVSGSLWESVRENTRATSAALYHASKDLAQQFVPEIRLRAFLLPTGRGRREFFCLLDFRQAVEELARGWFRRPRLEIWAARPDIDRGDLAAVLRDEFTRQLDAERRRVLSTTAQKFSPQLDWLRGKRNKAGTLVQGATMGFASSLALLFLLANPIFDLVFLVLAVFAGAGGITKALHYIQLTARMRSSAKDWEREHKDLERQLDGKNREFLEAIENVDLKVHPVLERILVHIGELEGDPYVAEVREASPEDCPSVDQHLKSERYRREVPAMYHPLIDVELM